MKRFFSLLLALTFLLSFAACASGGASNEPDDPNLGVYYATTAEYSGFTVSIDEILEGGMEITLKPNGKCDIMVGGKTVGGKWTLSETGITVKGGGVEWEGSLTDGEMRLQYGDDVIFNLTKNPGSDPSVEVCSICPVRS